ncbi:MAG: DUF1553 domain-containing protein [Acidobacteriota bacterium]
MSKMPICAVILIAGLAGSGTAQTAAGVFEGSAGPGHQATIDELVFGKLERLGIRPANPCSDSVFLRRAHLDVIGTLPTSAEARSFLQDRSPDKRRALIDQLLRRDEFADYWAMKWGDLLRIKAEFPINLWPNAVQAYHRWVRTCIHQNVPYDRFVREMLTSNGSNFRVPPVNFYRAVQSREPEAIARAVALTFMGARAENWPESRLSGMAAFFSNIGYKSTTEWKEEIVFFDSFKAPAHGAADGSWPAIFPDGTGARLSPDQDPRVVFAHWLLAPQNPWFARNLVNRIWYWLQGRGIIHEPDDIRAGNPASNPELLAYLERELITAGYDWKHIYRLILNSKTYQLSSVPGSDDPVGEANFAFYPLSRLDAEVLIDAICQVTGTKEEYSSLIPEPYTFIPDDQRSIALADGSITSPFLEMFGRPPRDTGLESERNNRPTPAQRLHLLNSSHIRRKIEQGPKLRQLIQSSRNPLDMLTDLYLTILSRYPTEEELKVVQSYSRSAEVNRREIMVDLTWALINSPEFLYRH